MKHAMRPLLGAATHPTPCTLRTVEARKGVTGR